MTWNHRLLLRKSGEVLLVEAMYQGDKVVGWTDPFPEDISPHNLLTAINNPMLNEEDFD